MIKVKPKTLFLRLDVVAAFVKQILNSQLRAVVMVIERLSRQFKKQQQTTTSFIYISL